MNKEEKSRYAELYAQRQMLGYKLIYCAFRNIPAVYRNHPVRSTIAVILVGSVFLGAYVFIKHILDPADWEQFRESRSLLLAPIVCSLLFLFGQSASFIDEWTHGRELAEQDKQLGKEIRTVTEPHSLPRSARPHVLPGNRVSAGDTIWSGTITMGDHIFVERLTYRFGSPRRGDIIVFKTDGIQGVQQNTHYVKRIAGLPGECVRIDPPNLLINDYIVTVPSIFKAISSSEGDYSGFQIAHGGVLRSPGDEFVLGPDEYFVLGDNTLNSKDSRYWGAVPRQNIIGKVTRIYWPPSRINALAENGSQ